MTTTLMFGVRPWSEVVTVVTYLRIASTVGLLVPLVNASEPLVEAPTRMQPFVSLGMFPA